MMKKIVLIVFLFSVSLAAEFGVVLGPYINEEYLLAKKLNTSLTLYPWPNFYGGLYYRDNVFNDLVYFYSDLCYANHRSKTGSNELSPNHILYSHNEFNVRLKDYSVGLGIEYILIRHINPSLYGATYGNYTSTTSSMYVSLSKKFNLSFIIIEPKFVYRIGQDNGEFSILFEFLNL